ncbi:PLC-like phosphodiesterase [Fimicolochytrium jonesii]|uniref:PLC-like phosphodiesterase n=1 Tax=Fimicolochytrium jonesii TaxID=1396493 RepID=UPI0022FF0A81|nr:PLC-like phosphodiesterase [Fimicolochytrium jonesii]KAI8820254.1 PLC-like phosphodiesterase [Fimicolochytrium jonesii]
MFKTATLLVGVAAASSLLSGVLATSPCNGMQELCGLRYDQVTYAATHNSGSKDLKYDCHTLAKSCKAGKFLCWGFEKGCNILVPDAIERCLWDNQVRAIDQQLSDGIRSFDIDTCQIDDGSVVNCHGAGNKRAIGGDIRQTLQSVASWVNNNPNEIITLNFGDSDGDAASMARYIQGGLQDILGKWLFERSAGAPWPTLGELIAKDKRVVVMFGSNLFNAGPKPAWLQHYDDIIEDPYFKVLADDDNPARLEASYLQSWCLRDPKTFTKLQVIDATIAIVLPQLEADLRKLKFPTSVCSRDLAKSVNYGSLDRIADFCAQKMGYIYRVRVDHEDASNVVAKVRELNGRNVKRFGKKGGKAVKPRVKGALGPHLVR